MAGCPGNAIKALVSLLLSSACLSWWVKWTSTDWGASFEERCSKSLSEQVGQQLFIFSDFTWGWLMWRAGRQWEGHQAHAINGHTDILKNWSIIALQCCDGFCRTTKWISYLYTYISLPVEPPSLASSNSFRSSQSIELSSLCYKQLPTSYFKPSSVCISICVCVCSPVSLQPLWTVACQAPLSMWFSGQEYWRGLPFPSPGDLPDLGIKPMSPVSPALQADSLPLSHQGSPYISMWLSQFVPPSPSPAGTGTLKIDWPVCRSFSPPGTEKAQLSLRSKSRTGKAAKFWVELEPRRGTRGGQIVSRRTTRGWGGWQMMKRVGLGWLYPGGCEFVTWQTQGGNDELSGKPGWSAQANRKIHLTTSRTSLHKRPWWDISIGPRVWKCWPFSNSSVPVWGQTWGIAQISLYTIGCWKP